MSEKDREQDIDRQVEELLKEAPVGKKSRKTRRPMTKKKKIVIGCAGVAAALLLGMKLFGGTKEIVPVVQTGVAGKRGYSEHFISQWSGIRHGQRRCGFQYSCGNKKHCGKRRRSGDRRPAFGRGGRFGFAEKRAGNCSKFL